MVRNDVSGVEEWFGTDLDSLEHIRSDFGEKTFLPFFQFFSLIFSAFLLLFGHFCQKNLQKIDFFKNEALNQKSARQNPRYGHILCSPGLGSHNTAI